MVARRGAPGDAGSSLNGPHAPPTGDHKGPPILTSSTLAPTDVDVYWAYPCWYAQYTCVSLDGKS